MSARQRLRSVSPERIAKVAAALGDRCKGVQLKTDGSAVLLTDGARIPLAGPSEADPNEWDDVLQGSA